MTLEQYAAGAIITMMVVSVQYGRALQPDQAAMLFVRCFYMSMGWPLYIIWRAGVILGAVWARSDALKDAPVEEDEPADIT